MSNSNARTYIESRLVLLQGKINSAMYAPDEVGNAEILAMFGELTNIIGQLNRDALQ